MKYLIEKNRLNAFIACCIAISLLSCNSKDESAADTRQPYVIPDSLMRTLSVDTVKTANLSYSIKFNGMVDFNTDKVVNIFPLVSGNLQNIKAMPGDHVSTGQVLGVIKSAEVANYNSALINAEAALHIAAKQLAQQKDLYKSGLASEVDITSAQAGYDQAVAAKIAGEKILSINGNNRNGEFLIKAPINGFIVQKNVTNGISIRTDNSAPMFTISDLKNVWVQANVYEENISKVHEGDPVDVSTISYPDKIFKGKVSKLMNVLDPTSKVLKMRVVLDNPDYLLKPEMFATVTVNKTEQQKAICISSGALIFDHSQYYVIIIKGKKDVQIRSVEVININGKKAYIKSGLQPGEHLVSSNALLIYGSLNS